MAGFLVSLLFEESLLTADVCFFFFFFDFYKFLMHARGLKCYVFE